MPMRTDVPCFQNESASPKHSQTSPSGLPRRSNSVSSPTSADVNLSRPGRQRRRRHGSGASVGSSDGQPSRKCRRIRSSNGNGVPEVLSVPENICNSEYEAEGSSKHIFADSGESDSNCCMEAIKTVVEEVAVVRVDDDVSGTQTPQSNDDGNNSENEDEQVAKLPPPSFQDPESTCDSSTITPSVASNLVISDSIVQRSLSCPSPSLNVSCSISCDPSVPSTSSTLSVDAAFRKQVVSNSYSTARLPKTSLSSFSSVTSLVDSVAEPLSIALSPGETLHCNQSQEHQEDTSAIIYGIRESSSDALDIICKSKLIKFL